MGVLILFAQLVCGIRFIIAGILFVNVNKFLGKEWVGARMGWMSFISGKLSSILKSWEKVAFKKKKKNRQGELFAVLITQYDISGSTIQLLIC